jgi:dephospho-CoA kinase
MFVVGVTGGIGSGKTAVTDMFAALGIDIVDADIAARIVVEPGTPALTQIAEHFGASILQADGSLDRAALRRVVFQDPAAKSWLEQLLHPLIGVEIRRQLDRAASAYAVFVSPLLVESSQRQLCDRLLVVDVPESVQLARTVVRDNNDPEQVKRIIAAQTSRKQRLALADDVIENTGTLDELRQRVTELHRRYLATAQAGQPEHNRGD